MYIATHFHSSERASDNLPKFKDSNHHSPPRRRDPAYFLHPLTCSGVWEQQQRWIHLFPGGINSPVCSSGLELQKHIMHYITSFNMLARPQLIGISQSTSALLTELHSTTSRNQFQHCSQSKWSLSLQLQLTRFFFRLTSCPISSQKPRSKTKQ